MYLTYCAPHVSLLFKLNSFFSLTLFSPRIHNGRYEKGNLQVHAFFISNTFVSNTGLELAKNQVNVKQHPVTGLLLFETYSLPRYHQKIIGQNLKISKITSMSSMMLTCIKQLPSNISR